MSGTANHSTAEHSVKNADDCLQSARELKQCLLDERAALSKRDPSQLQAAIDNKSAQLRVFAEQLKAAQKGREQTMTDTANTSWDRLTQLTEECEQLNAGNGAAIRLRMHHVEQQISLLRGQGDALETYGPSGTPAQPGSSRPLVEA